MEKEICDLIWTIYVVFQLMSFKCCKKGNPIDPPFEKLVYEVGPMLTS